MSMDPVILQCLGRICNEELQLFERVMVVHEVPEGRTCNICIGKHFIFFVSREMDRLVEGQKLSYLHIEKAVTDSSTKRFFLLELAAGNRGPGWQAGDRILIESQHREMLLESIALCWQAEYMFQFFQVKKFPQAKATIANSLSGLRKLAKNNIDMLQVSPFKGYDDNFSHRGYGFFLRMGFKSVQGLKNGTFIHDAGWEVSYNSQSVVVPPGVEITMHVDDHQTIQELERSAIGADDLRTVATAYKQSLTEHLDQFYVLVNGSYMKRMNRSNDVAAWDGWEFFVRSKEFAFACVLLRREYIPPLCDITQDVAVLLRCPAQSMNQDMCEVLLDECRFVADTLAPNAEGRTVYKEIIQAKLDTLQFNEEGYRWVEGRLKLTPIHKRPAAVKFVKSIVHILVSDGWDENLDDVELFRDVPVLHNPLDVPAQMLSDAEPLLGNPDGKSRIERQNAWYWRISRYLAYCVDGGLLGDRFTMGTLVQAIGRFSSETDKVLKAVIEFLLQVVPRNDWSRSIFSGARLPLSQLLQDPEEFGKHSFNERVMKLLLTENYIANEWRKKSGGSGASYERLLASLLTNEHVGVGLRTLICRQILETTNLKDSNVNDERQVQVLVPALVKVMQGGNLSLTSCATAALVNLSCGKMSTKNLLVSEGCMKLCIKQLKAKDDDLTLYTLYLLVNLTKTPHHRSIVVREGGVPLLVDILTSSYQNLRKQKVLAELASVVGQLCNESETRTLISDEFPVVPCLLWVYDAAPPNSKLKSKLLFALRQLCVLGQNKVKVGQHVIPRVLEELSLATPSFEECATNAVLLLTMLASVHSNAIRMNVEGRLDDSLCACGLQTDPGVESKTHRFSPNVWEKVAILRERIREAEYASGGR